MVDQPENEVTTESEANVSVGVGLGQLGSGGEFASGEGFGYHGDAAPGSRNALRFGPMALPVHLEDHQLAVAVIPP